MLGDLARQTSCACRCSARHRRHGVGRSSFVPGRAVDSHCGAPRRPTSTSCDRAAGSGASSAARGGKAARAGAAHRQRPRPAILLADPEGGRLTSDDDPQIRAVVAASAMPADAAAYWEDRFALLPRRRRGRIQSPTPARGRIPPRGRPAQVRFVETRSSSRAYSSPFLKKTVQLSAGSDASPRPRCAGAFDFGTTTRCCRGRIRTPPADPVVFNFMSSRVFFRSLGGALFLSGTRGDYDHPTVASTPAVAITSLHRALRRLPLSSRSLKSFAAIRLFSSRLLFGGVWRFEVLFRQAVFFVFPGAARPRIRISIASARRAG